MEKSISEGTPFFSFCMSTFKRPELLRTQLLSILEQTFYDFEIVVSDNDPDKSAETIVNEVKDARVK